MVKFPQQYAFDFFRRWSNVGNLRLQFDWQILDSNGLDKWEHFKDDFFDLIGDAYFINMILWMNN